MPDGEPEKVSLALFFEGEAALGQTVSILQDVEKGYRAALSIVTPANMLAEASRKQPQVEVRSGSLFVELSSVVEPGAWVAVAIAVFKFAISSAAEVVALPASMQANWSKYKTLAAENREKFIEIVKRSPAVDEKAYRRIREINDRLAADSLGKTETNKRSEDSSGDRPPTIEPGVTAATESGSAQAVAESFSVLSRGVEVIKFEAMRLGRQVEVLQGRLVAEVAVSNAEEVGQAAGALKNVRRGLEESGRSADHAQASLDLYVARILSSD